MCSIKRLTFNDENFDLKFLVQMEATLQLPHRISLDDPCGSHLCKRESDYSPASQLFCRVKKTMIGNYHKLDLVNIDAHTKFGLIMSIRSQDIERKRNSDLNKGP